MGFMNGKMPRAFGVAALSAGLLGVSGCDEDSPLGNLAEQCGVACEDDAIINGHASITGVGALDGFFQAVVNFGNASTSLTGSINAELQGLQDDFGITDADLDSEGGLGPALQAKFDASTRAGVKIEMQPARCEVDAKASFEASVDCQVEAGCDVEVDPGMVEFECHGGCEVEASADIDCGASATLECTFQGPSVACEGTCEGTCTAEAGVECSGSCDGTCQGSCMVELKAGGSCDGECTGTCDGDSVDGASCDGTCKGSCELTGSAAASCNGSCEGTCEGSCTADAAIACEGECSGSCTMTPPDADCSAAVEAKCEAMADASVMCDGGCDGDFEPPSVMAECDASASCNAQAKAEAQVNVQCTPPSLTIDYELAADLSAEARAEFVAGIRNLKFRLPAIAAAFKKSRVVLDAGADLTTAAGDAAEGVVAQFRADADVLVAARIAACAPAAFRDSATVVSDASTDLQNSLSASASLGDVDGLGNVF